MTAPVIITLQVLMLSACIFEVGSDRALCLLLGNCGKDARMKTTGLSAKRSTSNHRAKIQGRNSDFEWGVPYFKMVATFCAPLCEPFCKPYLGPIKVDISDHESITKCVVCWMCGMYLLQPPIPIYNKSNSTPPPPPPVIEVGDSCCRAHPPGQDERYSCYPGFCSPPKPKKIHTNWECCVQCPDTTGLSHTADCCGPEICSPFIGATR